MLEKGMKLEISKIQNTKKITYYNNQTVSLSSASLSSKTVMKIENYITKTMEMAGRGIESLCYANNYLLH